MELKGYTAHTDQGPFLQVNEDAIEMDLPNGLFLLLDGFGGSRVAVNLAKNIKDFYAQISGDPDATMPFFFSHKYLLEGNALVNSMHNAHEQIKRENASKQVSQKSGASCLAAVMAENLITFVGTGNCAGFLLRDARLSLVCRPDNMEWTSGVAVEKHLQTSPASALGLFDDLHFEVSEIKVLENDLFALFSDGVYSRVDFGEVGAILQNSSANDQKAKDLFALANANGNTDNQSALFLQF